jgi:AcrR family transcriptional regulator
MGVPRATPLSPDARRASIIAATLPLLRVHGRAVTTAQIAMAAGVAEGTLFRVFPDKESLICAAIASAVDTAPTEAALAHIDGTQSLRDQLVAAVEILERRLGQIWQLLSMLGVPVGPAVACKPPAAPPDDTRVRELITAIFAAHRDEIRCEPAHAARLLRALAVAGAHPRLSDPALTAHEIVSLLLDGIRTRDEES